jgi:hypothetical protein
MFHSDLPTYCSSAKYRAIVQYLLLGFTIFEVLEGEIHRENEHPSAVKGTVHHAKTSFSTEICAGATIRVVQYLLLLRFFQTCMH